MIVKDHEAVGIGRQLQFGHGTDAVDEIYAKASTAADIMLQFGHGTDAVDDPDHSDISPGCKPRLQFGHGTDAVDDARTNFLPYAETLASIRPRHRRRG